MSAHPAAALGVLITAPEEGAAALIRRGQCQYAACYCEENVYKLCERLLAAPGHRAHPASQLYAVFTSNAARTVPLWCQRAGRHTDGLVVWDYHVMLVEQPVVAAPARVYDLDTTLEFACHFEQYAHHALRIGSQLPQHMQRWYRVVPAASYLQHFSSDRSHMINEHGEWNAPPPPWPCIKSSGDGAANTNLFSKYLAGMGQCEQLQGQHAAGEYGPAAEYGIVMDEPSFLQHFAPD